jgi:poly-gamma-glutamate capsule biosynthesis protein CapA/YwtB (metallophosphatase superfamily)
MVSDFFNNGHIPCNINSLKYAGCNVLNLRNNHTLDHGSQSLSETVDILSQNGILVLDNDTEALISFWCKTHT